MYTTSSHFIPVNTTQCQRYNGYEIFPMNTKIRLERNQLVMGKEKEMEVSSFPSVHL
jgi:hypothetical protein